MEALSRIGVSRFVNLHNTDITCTCFANVTVYWFRIRNQVTHSLWVAQQGGFRRTAYGDKPNEYTNFLGIAWLSFQKGFRVQNTVKFAYFKFQYFHDFTANFHKTSHSYFFRMNLVVFSIFRLDEYFEKWLRHTEIRSFSLTLIYCTWRKWLSWKDTAFSQRRKKTKKDFFRVQFIVAFKSRALSNLIWKNMSDS